MWIRSQNREVLKKCNTIYIDDDIIEKNIILGVGNDNDNYILGQYSTYEKALKVLDAIVKQISFCCEIKKMIKPYTLHDYFEPYEAKSNVVFQMPQDDEVK